MGVFEIVNFKKDVTPKMGNFLMSQFAKLVSSKWNSSKMVHFEIYHFENGKFRNGVT